MPHDIPRYRMIEACHVPMTNTKPSRIKIFERARFNDDRLQSKIFSYSFEFNNVRDQAIDLLVKNGFNIKCESFHRDSYVFLCDNWGDEFKQVKQIKK